MTTQALPPARLRSNLAIERVIVDTPLDLLSHQTTALLDVGFLRQKNKVLQPHTPTTLTRMVQLMTMWDGSIGGHPDNVSSEVLYPAYCDSRPLGGRRAERDQALTFWSRLGNHLGCCFSDRLSLHTSSQRK